MSIPSTETYTSPSYIERLTGPESARLELEKFVNNPALANMVELFAGSAIPPDLNERVTFLQEVAAKNWDFRKGAERQATDWIDGELGNSTSALSQKIFEDARELGMVESSRPTNRTPDYLVVLGGANHAPYDRLKYGLESVDDFGQLVFLGAARALPDTEREKAKDYAPDAQTEFELGCGAFETLLGATLVETATEVDADEQEWGIRVYKFNDPKTSEPKKGFVLNSPRMVGTNRASTYDNWEFFTRAARLASFDNATIVSVTTGFYVPAQHFPALQTLMNTSATVETIGHDAAYSGATRTASQLLQETKAAIDAAARLHDILQKPISQE